MTTINNVVNTAGVRSGIFFINSSIFKDFKNVLFYIRIIFFFILANPRPLQQISGTTKDVYVHDYEIKTKIW